MGSGRGDTSYSGAKVGYLKRLRRDLQGGATGGGGRYGVETYLGRGLNRGYLWISGTP